MCVSEAGEEQEGKFLGRSICWRTDDVIWTGNLKLAEEYDVQSFLNADLMSKESAAKYQRTAAKLNDLALDNPLIPFASEEASTSMSSPRQGEEVKLKRILRFLRKRPTTTYLYEWQDHPGELTGYKDNDWAGCKLTRRSTSGGVILHGSHLLLHYSRTQAGVALSSAEAELSAALKMGCEILGISVKSIPPTTENWLRKRNKYSMKNDKSTEDKHETNHINNKYNDMNMNTRKMHNT